MLIDISGYIHVGALQGTFQDVHVYYINLL